VRRAGAAALLVGLLGGCASAYRVPVEPPVFSSPEAAAIWWVHSPGHDLHDSPRLVTISLASSSETRDETLRRELSLDFDIQAILRSDTLYGGEARFRTATGEYYLVVDARIQPKSDSLVSVTTETCRGWPCHSEAVVVVRRSGSGYIAVGTRGGFIE